RFEITPVHPSPGLFKSLSDKGYYQCGFHTTLYGELPNDYMLNSELDTSISIRELAQHEFDIFGDIYVKGFNMPPHLKNYVAQNNKVLLNNEHWTIYIASIKDKPAG